MFQTYKTLPLGVTKLWKTLLHISPLLIPAPSTELFWSQFTTLLKTLTLLVQTSFQLKQKFSELIPEKFMDHWIGLTNMITGGNYSWLDNTAVNYARWEASQPNDDAGCVVVKAVSFLWEY